MTEYISEAVVLGKEPTRDLDVRVSLFTKKFGKLTARARSARRITSKLSGHLEPGNVVQARLIEKNGLQAVDALKKSSLAIAPADLYFLSRVLAESEPDLRLWHALVSPSFSWSRVLGFLGWDPRGAACALCGVGETGFFDVSKQELYCRNCASKFARSDVVFIHS